MMATNTTENLESPKYSKSFNAADMVATGPESQFLSQGTLYGLERASRLIDTGMALPVEKSSAWFLFEYLISHCIPPFVKPGVSNRDSCRAQTITC